MEVAYLMNLNTLARLSKKLRHAANVLDELLEVPGTPAVVKKIQRTLARPNPKHKGFNYRGKHWTQQPKNKAKLHKMIAASKEARRVKAKTTSATSDPRRSSVFAVVRDSEY